MDHCARRMQAHVALSACTLFIYMKAPLLLMPAICPPLAAGLHPLSMASLSYCAPAAIVAYCGESGVLGLAQLDPLVNIRQRRPHVALSGIAVDGNEAWVLRAEDIPGNGGLYNGSAGGTSRRGGGGGSESGGAGACPLIDPRQTLYCVRFSPNVTSGARWVAAGGAAGLMRLHRVLFDEGSP